MTPYEKVTAKIVAALEQGAAPWVQPWATIPGTRIAQNAVTGRPYSGINVLLTWAATQAFGWRAPSFLTYQQAKAAGGHVRKGEEGTTVFLLRHVPGKTQDDGEEKRGYSMLKAYTVFNVEQCEGLPARIAEPVAPDVRHSDARRPEVEAFVQATGAVVREGHEKAAYIPSADIITMPAFTAFDTADHYYATLLHELAHWTGRQSRLDRTFGARFGDDAYAAEELVAELTTAFLCADLGVNGDLRHAGYLQSWIKVLKADARAIFTVASKAQAAADYLRKWQPAAELEEAA